MDIHLLFSFSMMNPLKQLKHDLFEEKVRVILLPTLSCCRYNVNVCILL